MNYKKFKLDLKQGLYYAMEMFMMHLLKSYLFGFAFFLVPVFSTFISANSLTEEEMERWLNSDDLNPPNYQKVEVNNGVLFFLDAKPSEPIHHHRNAFTLYKTSLNDGWIKLEQCHQNMDRVPRVQVVFNKERIRDIKVINADSIGKAWVENNTVQLEDVKDNALLCIEAWSKALFKNKDGSYRLTNGPFMRKFLDGYFPIHVTIEVDFKETNLKLVSVEPTAQSGFKVIKAAKTVSMDAWFEGRLETKLIFVN